MRYADKLVLNLLVLVLLYTTGCKKETDSNFNGATGLIKFDFKSDPVVGDYSFEIGKDPTGEADLYLVQNPDSLPKGTDITKLKANFQPVNSLVKIKVNGMEQVSDVTVNDFTNPVVYNVYAENGNVKNYNVKVNVARRNLAAEQYIFINQGTFSENEVQEIVKLYGVQPNRKVAVGLSVIISVLNGNPVDVVATLNDQLALALKYELPICIKLDTEIWWEYRNDLWNWWDPGKTGYNPDNKDNVEWTDWNRDAAIKIGWLNWGSQIRMVPCPNLMSPKYKEAWHTELTKSVNTVKIWYEGLPSEKKYLFGGIVVGWESSIGVNIFHYPDGNSYIDRPASNDPTYGKTMTDLPSRGVQTIGYAAVKSAGIATSGTLTEAMQTEVVRRHLLDLSKTVYDLGIPRELIFTHCGGWMSGESMYTAAVNDYSCPGWSFYKYASDPTKDLTAMDALAKSKAPYWGAVEWLLGGDKTKAEWFSALTKSLDNKSRMVVIYNWNSINTNADALNAIKEKNK